MTDAYNILGVTKAADQDEIKKAYRKLAARYHPDKPDGNADKFKEIQNAYDQIKDPEKRAQYDQPKFHSHQHPHQQGQNPFQNAGFHFNFSSNGIDGNPFEAFFRQHAPQPPQRRNRDLRITVSVPLASTLIDQTKTVKVHTTKNNTFEVNIKIPQGIVSGSAIKFTGLGDNFFESLDRGDLYVIVDVDNGVYDIDGKDITLTLNINSLDAIIGAEHQITTVDGTTLNLRIPPGTQNGTKMRIQGRGIFAVNDPKRGDMFVKLNLTTPKLSDEDLQKLRSLRLTLS